MPDYQEFGRNLRDLLRGLLGDQELGPKGTGGLPRWGRSVDARRLPDLYGPRRVKKFALPPGGIDNLSLSSEDTFEIPGKGEFTVGFKGYFRVAREDPTTDNWATANIFVQTTDLRLEGKTRELGTMQVRLNPDFVSAGQTFGPGQENAAAKCRIATAAVFSLPEQGLELFNKEPILLMNDAIDSVPPVEDPNGEAHIYRLPLFDTRRPDGEPAAYLTRLRYTVGNYLTEREAEAIRSRLPA